MSKEYYVTFGQHLSSKLKESGRNKKIDKYPHIWVIYISNYIPIDQKKTAKAKKYKQPTFELSSMEC